MMTVSDNNLGAHLAALRVSAGLSIEEVCDRTKIQPRFVRALEEGRYEVVASNTLLRAFALAMAQACGGDKDLVAGLVRRVLSAAAPVEAPPRTFDTPAPAPQPKKEIPSQAGGGAGLQWAPAEGPALGAPGGLAPLIAASARLRSLPLPALLALLGLAGALSFGTAWGLDQWKRHSALQMLTVAMAPTAAVAEVAAEAPAPQKSLAVPAAVEAENETAAPAEAADLSLALRARRDCWLVLQLDGKRLPTITLKDGDKIKYSFNDKAVLLAGNLGALRVWSGGENLGYLGELGQRANALVFEKGKRPRLDSSAALPLPSGVPQ